MYKLHLKLKQLIFSIIDFFYPLVKSFVPLQTFRYAVCGGGNLVLSLFIFAFSYNFIFCKNNVDLGFITISPHIAAYILAFIITFPIGFYLSMYVVFYGSNMQRRVQLFRYLVVVLCTVILNYVFLKFFVEILGFWPSIAMACTTVIVVCFSYFAQQKFSFKKKKN